jgi:hypothetical protein
VFENNQELRKPTGPTIGCWALAMLLLVVLVVGAHFHNNRVGTMQAVQELNYCNMPLLSAGEYFLQSV